jgi:hypothetical protein
MIAIDNLATTISTKAMRAFVFCNEEWLRAATAAERAPAIAAMRAEAVEAILDALNEASQNPERAADIADAAVTRILNAGCEAIEA